VQTTNTSKLHWQLLYNPFSSARARNKNKELKGFQVGRLRTRLASEQNEGYVYQVYRKLLSVLLLREEFWTKINIRCRVPPKLVSALVSVLIPV